MRALHNFRTGPLLSNDHPVFNTVEERGAFLNAFRERPEFMQNPLFAVVDVLSLRRGKLLVRVLRGRATTSLDMLDKCLIEESFIKSMKLFQRDNFNFLRQS